MRKLWKKLLAPKTSQQMAAPVSSRTNVESGAEIPQLPAMHQHAEHFRLIQSKAAELMPALDWDEDIFADYRSWDDELDCFTNESDAVRFYVLQEGFTLEDALLQYAAYISWVKIQARETGMIEYQYACRSGYTHIRMAEAETEQISRALLDKCAEKHIRIVRHKGSRGLYDYVSCQQLTAQVESWPGSVDDAATYGSWSWIQ